MTDDMIDILILQCGVMEKWPTQKQCHAFARAIEQAARRAALEEAAGACEAVRDLKWRGTVFYSAAATECATTIRALAGETSNG